MVKSLGTACDRQHATLSRWKRASGTMGGVKMKTVCVKPLIR